MSEHADVEVTIGANITPFQRSMAEAKNAAGEFGEKAGFEFGNRAAYKAERRIKTGITNAFKAAANSPDIGTAAVGIVESLESAFKIAGPALLGLGIGTFIGEQLTKAGEHANEFFDKFAENMAVNVGEASVGELRKVEENAKELEKEYADRGLLEKMIFGSDQDKLIETVRTQVAMIKKIAEERAVKLIDDETTVEISESIFDKARAQADLLRDEYKKRINDAESGGEKEALKRQLEAKIGEINKKAQEKMMEPDVKEKEKYDRERERLEKEGDELLEENIKKGQTAQQRLDQANKDYYDAIKRAAEAVFTGDELGRLTANRDMEKAILKQKESQDEINKKKEEDRKKNQEIAIDVSRNRSEREDVQNKILGLKGRSQLFNGSVSSLRHIGLGGSVGAQKDTGVEGELKEANKTLDKLLLESTVLNQAIKSA